MAIRTSFEVAEIVTGWEPVNTVDGLIQRRSVKMGSRDIGVIRVHVGNRELWRSQLVEECYNHFWTNPKGGIKLKKLKCSINNVLEI